MKMNFLSRRFPFLAFAVSFALAAGVADASQNFPLSGLDLGKVRQDWGTAHANKSVDDHPLSVGGRAFTNGLGTHAESDFTVKVNGNAEAFSAQVGIDDEVGMGRGNGQFQVFGDGRLLWQSKMLHRGDAPEAVRLTHLSGIKQLAFDVDTGTNGINDTHADWANAEITMRSGAPEAFTPPPEQAEILTPAPSPKPRINNAAIFGVRPNSPFLFTMAVTGNRPMTFSADDLPDGLTLDTETGRIMGELRQEGTHLVTLRAKNALGAAEQKFKIICGQEIGLTPAMGWNSWNCFADSVTADNIKAAADAMVKSGLINHGWTYINIDDFWEVNPQRTNDPTLQGPERDAEGHILPNPRFPDMKGLTAYVHGKGLKIGLYSSPGAFTCGGCIGSYRHEDLDAEQYANWGFDYLKYDWCSYKDVAQKETGQSDNFSVATLEKPYQVMHAALEKAPRDIVFSLCQYGMGDVWKWGAQVGGNSWRTTYDIWDSWNSMSSNGFGEADEAKYAGPGHFNDPDMLVVGQVGWGNLHSTRLTPNEQYTHISLWCLLASPLLIGCDMTKLDPFTLSLLSNDEVLAVDQDPLGQQASRVSQDGHLEVWAKDMEDGSKAVGLFNRSRLGAPVTAKWSDLRLTGKQRIRDLWRQKDLGKFSDKFTANVPPHGVVLVRLWPANN